MRLKLLLAAAPLIVLAPQASAATIWDIVEGPKASTRGSWTFPSAGLTGDARMTLPTGKTLTYGVRGSTIGEEYTFERAGSSDLVACSYHGEVALGSGKIVGSRICGGVTSVWIARPR